MWPNKVKVLQSNWIGRSEGAEIIFSIVKNNFLGLEKNQSIDFYYIHSYFVKPDDPNIIHVFSQGDVPSCIKLDNIYGCQFHPEKSHTIGLNILKQFSIL